MTYNLLARPLQLFNSNVNVHGLYIFLIFRSVVSAVKWLSRIVCACSDLSNWLVFLECKYANSFLFDLWWRVVWLLLSTSYAPPRITQLMNVSEHIALSYIICSSIQVMFNHKRMSMGGFELVALLKLILENLGIYRTYSNRSCTLNSSLT